MKKHLVILFAIAMMISACSPAEPAPSLTGTTWKLTSYGSLTTQKPVVAEEGTLTLSADGKVTGVGACNEFSGTYEVKGQQIIFNQFDWGSMFCPEPQMSQESTVYDTLDNHTVDFKLEGNTLTLTRPLSETAGLVLVFEAVNGSAAASSSDQITILRR